MNNESTEVLGIFITKDDVSNMHLEHIHVTDYAIQVILKSIQLTIEAQEDTVERLVARTPGFISLEQDERIRKMKIALTQETVLEYLRLHGYIKENVDMVEMGIDDEGSMIVSVYYVTQTEEIKQVFKDTYTEEDIQKLEVAANAIGALDGSVNILEEAKKRYEAKNNIVPFQNREMRRQLKKKKQ